MASESTYQTVIISKLVDFFYGACANAEVLLATLGFVLLSLILASAQQTSSQLRHKQDSEIGGVKFSVRQDFELAPSADSTIAFMRHAKEEIALFVAVPDKQNDGNYLTELSKSLVSQLIPQETGFVWKIVRDTSDRTLSKYQTASGASKGLSLNSKTYVQIDYLIVKGHRREVLVGSIKRFGAEREAKFLFEVEGREYSFLG